MVNKYGLPRHIPEEVALEIRRRSKFGCVVCRCAIYQYEHIDPEYAEAKAHDPDRICLLCGGCHDRVTRGRLSKRTVVARYAEIQRSNDVKRPFEELDLCTQNIRVGMGTAMFEYAERLIRVNGRDLLTVTPPANGSAFPTVNGVFCDREGRQSLQITDNVCEGPTDAWDIRVVGRQVTIKSGEDRTALVLDVDPPDTVTIAQLDMYLDNCHVICNDDALFVGQVHGGRYTYIGLGRIACKGVQIAVDVNSLIGPPVLQGLRIAGDEGVIIEGTGIRVGVGAQCMNVRDLRVWVR